MPTQIDHLVVAATSLEQGVQWCEAVFGITPALGGEHALFGTHNRLFKIATPKFSMAYFEIIAINPEAVRPKKTTFTHTVGSIWIILNCKKVFPKSRA
jgi:Glyoxalase-like domain